MTEHWAGVIMAAGAGSRMVSRAPKPLHKVCGKEMICYPVELLRGLGIERILVVVAPGIHSPVREVLGDGVEYVISPPLVERAMPRPRPLRPCLRARAAWNCWGATRPCCERNLIKNWWSGAKPAEARGEGSGRP